MAQALGAHPGTKGCAGFCGVLTRSHSYITSQGGASSGVSPPRKAAHSLQLHAAQSGQKCRHASVVTYTELTTPTSQVFGDLLRLLHPLLVRYCSKGADRAAVQMR